MSTPDSPSVGHVEDVAMGNIRATARGRPGERYILGGENLTQSQLAEYTLEILGKKAPIVSILRPILETITMISQAMRIPLPYNPNVIPYAVKFFWVNNQKAREELGVEFRSPHDVLRPTVEWLRDAGHVN